MNESLTIVVDRAEDGLYRATVPEHEGIIVKAGTIDQLFVELALEIAPIVGRPSAESEDDVDNVEGFDADLDYVLDKNAELYRRLAR